MPELRETIARLRVLTENFREDSDGFGVDRPDLVLLLDAAEESERIVACELGHAYNREYTKCPTCGFYHLKVEVKKLRACLDDAPHGADCERTPGMHPDAHAYKPCNCWKSALRSLQTHGRVPESTPEAKQEASPARKETNEPTS